MEDQVERRWRKSSYSGNGGGDCVEVTTRHPGTIAVRDSKNPSGAALTLTPADWHDFTAGIKTGEYDLT